MARQDEQPGEPGAQVPPRVQERPGTWPSATFGEGTTTLEIFLDEPGRQRLANPDEELRSRCMLLKRALERPVKLVTGDCGAELRAEAHGLESVAMPEKYSKDAHRRQMAAKDDAIESNE